MLENIAKALAQLKSQGAFSAKKATDVTDLHIDISDIGRLKFPIKASVAKKLIKVAKPATFGWREQTRLDTDVRDVWKIPKSRVKIDKRRWNKTLKPTLEQFKDELGLPQKSQLKAELHDMVIYAPGQFFLPHQDSEKSDGMVATLVVVLPSSHSGGTLIIDHHGEKKRYQSSRAAADKLSFFAFYADCYHEVKPVKEGYRIALIYNLLLSSEEEIVASPEPDLQQRVTKVLKSHFASSSEACERTNKLVYLLDHDYTARGLSWAHLKNDDRLRGAALTEAANALGLDMYLALADVQEMWECGSSDWDYYSRRWRGNDEENVELLYLIDGSITINHWRDAAGAAVDFPAWHVSDEESCWTKSNDALTPFQSEYEDWMGNYGNTMERWYHRAAIILWRREEHFSALLDISPELLMRELLSLTRKKAQQPQVQAAVEQFLPNWSGLNQYGTKPSVFSAVFKLALKLERVDLAYQLLLPLGIDALSPQTAKAMIKVQTAYGARCLLKVIQHWLGSPSCLHNDGIIGKFGPLIKRWLEQSPEAHHTVTHCLLVHQLDALTQWHKEQAEHDDFSARQRSAASRIEHMVELLSVAQLSGDDQVYSSTVEHLIKDESCYLLSDLIAIAGHVKRQAPYSNGMEQALRLLEFVRSKLSTVLDTPPRQAGDWSIIAADRCGCKDCQALSQFLQASDLNHKIWPLAEMRRQHIHDIIEGMLIPVNHTTERSGSPYKLHLEKDEQLFKQARLQRKQLEEALQALAG